MLAQGWVGGALTPPFEGVDEQAAMMGLLDGPAALCVALLAQAGSVAMQQAGMQATVATVTAPWGCLAPQQELSKSMLKANLAHSRVSSTSYNQPAKFSHPGNSAGDFGVSDPSAARGDWLLISSALQPSRLPQCPETA